ncbi:MAG: hypothetical protein AAGI48_03805 [Verrucomicrobiota bacterium]
MSKWLDRADLLKAHLEGVAGLSEIPVEVDRQKDINSVIAGAIAEASGACITILWTGGGNPDPKSNDLRMGGRFTVTVNGLEILREGATPLDEIAETVAEAMHDWNPNADDPNHRTHRLYVTDIQLAPHEHFLVYEIEGEILRMN